ncbi:hypothetical protein D3C87_863960 [compost metagenome]
MKSKKLYNVLEGFDYDLLNNPEFKEDSVREEIILPILKELGYSSGKPNQIIRSRTLQHPFVSIGSQERKINIIPDYVFEIDGKPCWVLDAKSPSESVIKSKNVEQAYSYAIHSEIRVQFFALCNGKEFALYNISEIKPVLHFEIQALPLYWETLKSILAPEKLLSENHSKFAKDLGLHLKRLGFDDFKSLIFPYVPIVTIGQLDNKMFSISAGGLNIDKENYVATFDFDELVFHQLKGKIPDFAFEKLLIRDKMKRSAISFADTAFYISFDCEVGKKLEENDKEIFLPLKVNRIF